MLLKRQVTASNWRPSASVLMSARWSGTPGSRPRATSSMEALASTPSTSNQLRSSTRWDPVPQATIEKRLRVGAGLGDDLSKLRCLSYVVLDPRPGVKQVVDPRALVVHAGEHSRGILKGLAEVEARPRQKLPRSRCVDARRDSRVFHLVHA